VVFKRASQGFVFWVMAFRLALCAALLFGEAGGGASRRIKRLIYGFEPVK